jgi:hypothetical protein
MTDEWGDYRFFLLPTADPTTGAPVVIDRSRRPYTERHGTEEGVVFFPTLGAARAYRRAMGLTDCRIVSPSGPAEALVMKSAEWWGCNVAYSIRRDGDGFRRDVTVLEAPSVPDGSHRHRA